MEIKSAVTLAQLPRTLHEDRPPRFGHVYSLAGQKRKRHEICAAIDGDSVSVYEVGDGRILSSYPVPATSSFLCSPSSIQIRRKNASSVRRTYSAIERVDKSIECFTEMSNGKDLPSVVRTTSPAVESSSDPVYLDTIFESGGSSGGDMTYKVLSVYQDGFCQTYSEDLAQKLWAGRLCDGQDSAPISISAILHVNLEDARKSFLKHRQDILATANDDSSFLAAVYKTDGQDVPSKSAMKIGVWKLERTQRKSGANLRPLTAHELPESDQWTGSSLRKIRFGIRASTVSAISGKGVYTYNIAELVPRMVSRFLNDGKELSDAIHLTPSLIVTTTPRSIGVCDTTYGTLQTSLDLERGPRARGAGAGGRFTTTELVAYFPRLEKVIALRRKRLVAFRIEGIPSLTGENKMLLIDSIGRGRPERIITQETPGEFMELDFGIVNPKMDDLLGSWHSAKAQLQELVKKGQVREFERALALEIKRYVSESTVRYHVTGPKLPRSACGIPDQVIISLHSMLFSFVGSNPETSGQDQPTRRGVDVSLPTPHIISWLSRLGLLRRHLVQRSAQPSHQDLEVLPGMLVEGLVKADPTLSLLEHFLDESASLDILDTVHVIKFLLSKALTQATSQDHSAVSLLEGPEDMVVDAQPVLSLTKTSSDLSDTQSDPKPLRVFNNLVIALEHFAAFGKSNVISSLRTSFDQDDLLALIQVLRQQLFRGGHTRSLQEVYPSPPPSANLTADKDGSLVQEKRLGLAPTVKLLSCCIDTIGPLGLFSQGEQSEFIVQLIPELKAEVTLATEALEEASCLQGILRETVRYADILQKDLPDNKQRRENKSTREIAATQKPGTIVALYSEPAADQGEFGALSGPLPLSLRPEEVVSKLKRRKGNGQILQRSAKEMHDLRHRAIGRYTLERLVL